MIGTSVSEYIWVVGWAVILHSIGPLCTVYCFIVAFVPESWRLWKAFDYWARIEMMFYFLTCAYQKFYMQRPASHPPPLGKDLREKLFCRCFDNATDLSADLSRWFSGAPFNSIGRDNMKQWLQWAFLNTDEDNPLLNEELDSYIKRIEVKLGMSFPSGKSDVKSIRLTLDKVSAFHRSMTWYMCIFVVDTMTHLYLRFNGFKFYRGSVAHTASILPPRPQALITACTSKGTDISYWYHRHTSQTELPILFVHGIGVGLYPYMQFLKEINQDRTVEEGQIGILAIEILPVSSRITRPVLRREELSQQLRTILQDHGFEKFVLVSHSYGSVISTYLLKTDDIALRIFSVILVDPITILLHQPDVVYNFTVRQPKFANQWLLWYFGSKDLGVAHTLSRTFFWSQNIIWQEDLLRHNATVFLCEKDSIINATRVRRYLEHRQDQYTQNSSDQAPTKKNEKDKKQDEKRERERGSHCLAVVWCPDLDHGGVFDLSPWRERLKAEVLQKARITP